ncbi:conserved Plasmodium protein, unknown function [Plasmodium ovale curtisi]|uniref:Vacuolar protein 14 C-terminal Fig4-binding domain-containing protein n=1 Tax=Plasmodium ovale curtisi TaxID=864141 RepID=A0A1A8X190_PLAOA|nr:conserved Plasmodium protein, unknown function [Plasmodium ovale curtisi]
MFLNLIKGLEKNEDKENVININIQKLLGDKTYEKRKKGAQELAEEVKILLLKEENDEQEQIDKLLNRYNNEEGTANECKNISEKEINIISKLNGKSDIDINNEYYFSSYNENLQGRDVDTNKSDEELVHVKKEDEPGEAEENKRNRRRCSARSSNGDEKNRVNGEEKRFYDADPLQDDAHKRIAQSERESLNKEITEENFVLGSEIIKKLLIDKCRENCDIDAEFTKTNGVTGSNKYIRNMTNVDMDEKKKRKLNDILYENAIHVEYLNRKYQNDKILNIIYFLDKKFIQSVNSSERCGGLISLAFISISLDIKIKYYFSEILKIIISCMNDPDSKVRYYVCESLYNLCKVSKSVAFSNIEDIFSCLYRIFSDPCPNVKTGGAFLDSLLKDMTCSYNNIFNIYKIIYILKDNIYIENTNVRQLIISWLFFLQNIPTVNIFEYFHFFIRDLFLMLSDENKDIQKQANQCLDLYIDKIITSNYEHCRSFFRHIVHIFLEFSTHKNTIIKHKSLLWIYHFINILNIHFYNVFKSEKKNNYFIIDLLKKIIFCTSDVSFDIHYTARKCNELLISFIKFSALDSVPLITKLLCNIINTKIEKSELVLSGRDVVNNVELRNVKQMSGHEGYRKRNPSKRKDAPLFSCVNEKVTANRGEVVHTENLLSTEDVDPGRTRGGDEKGRDDDGKGRDDGGKGKCGNDPNSAPEYGGNYRKDECNMRDKGIHGYSSQVRDDVGEESSLHHPLDSNALSEKIEEKGIYDNGKRGPNGDENSSVYESSGGDDNVGSNAGSNVGSNDDAQFNYINNKGKRKAKSRGGNEGGEKENRNNEENEKEMLSHESYRPFCKTEKESEEVQKSALTGSSSKENQENLGEKQQIRFIDKHEALMGELREKNILLKDMNKCEAYFINRILGKSRKNIGEEEEEEEEKKNIVEGEDNGMFYDNLEKRNIYPIIMCLHWLIEILVYKSDEIKSYYDNIIICVFNCLKNDDNQVVLLSLTVLSAMCSTVNNKFHFYEKISYNLLKLFKNDEYLLIHKAWFSNPLSAISFLLWLQKYELAYLICSYLTLVNINSDFFHQLDNFIFLFESPVFSKQRIHLIYPKNYPFLIKSLMILSLMLPLNTSNNILQKRLQISQLSILTSNERVSQFVDVHNHNGICLMEETRGEASVDVPPIADAEAEVPVEVEVEAACMGGTDQPIADEVTELFRMESEEKMKEHNIIEKTDEEKRMEEKQWDSKYTYLLNNVRNKFLKGDMPNRDTNDKKVECSEFVHIFKTVLKKHKIISCMPNFVTVPTGVSLHKGSLKQWGYPPFCSINTRGTGVIPYPMEVHLVLTNEGCRNDKKANECSPKWV